MYRRIFLYKAASKFAWIHTLGPSGKNNLVRPLISTSACSCSAALGFACNRTINDECTAQQSSCCPSWVATEKRAYVYPMTRSVLIIILLARKSFQRECRVFFCDFAYYVVGYIEPVGWYCSINQENTGSLVFVSILIWLIVGVRLCRWYKVAWCLWAKRNRSTIPTKGRKGR